jgi:hypothetical protein
VRASQKAVHDSLVTIVKALLKDTAALRDDPNEPGAENDNLALREMEKRLAKLLKVRAAAARVSGMRARSHTHSRARVRARAQKPEPGTPVRTPKKRMRQLRLAELRAGILVFDVYRVALRTWHWCTDASAEQCTRDRDALKLCVQCIRRRTPSRRPLGVSARVARVLEHMLTAMRA